MKKLLVILIILNCNLSYSMNRVIRGVRVLKAPKLSSALARKICPLSSRSRATSKVKQDSLPKFNHFNRGDWTQSWTDDDPMLFDKYYEDREYRQNQYVSGVIQTLLKNCNLPGEMPTINFEIINKNESNNCPFLCDDHSGDKIILDQSFFNYSYSVQKFLLAHQIAHLIQTKERCLAMNDLTLEIDADLIAVRLLGGDLSGGIELFKSILDKDDLGSIDTLVTKFQKTYCIIKERLNKLLEIQNSLVTNV